MTVYLVVLYLLAGLRATVEGTTMPQWLDFIGRQIPPEKRGILFGGRDCIGTLLGALAVSLLPLATKVLGFPLDFGVLFAAGAAAFLMSAFTLSRMPEVPCHPHERLARRSAWRSGCEARLAYCASIGRIAC